MRGIVLDLAVGFILGGAFGNHREIAGGRRHHAPDRARAWATWTSRVSSSCSRTGRRPRRTPASRMPRRPVPCTVNYGQFINSIVTFLIVAFAVFMLVRAANRLQPAEAAAPSTKDCPSSASGRSRSGRSGARSARPARGLSRRAAQGACAGRRTLYTAKCSSSRHPVPRAPASDAPALPCAGDGQPVVHPRDDGARHRLHRGAGVGRGGDGGHRAGGGGRSPAPGSTRGGGSACGWWKRPWPP